MHRSLFLPLLLSAASLSSCRKPEIVRYEVPKEKESPVLSTGAGMPMAEAPQPAGAAPEWQVPPGWKEGPASATRKGSYAVQDGDGRSVDISVTSFPGDVGGEEANLSRWRSQIGLPAEGDGSAAASEEVQAGELTGRVYDLEGPLARTLVCWFQHQRSSWFFKMTGDSALVEAQKPAFQQFIQSVRFGVPSGE